MPSIRATMLGLGLVVTTVLQLTSANPIPTTTEDLADRSEDCEPSKPVRVTPTMPLSGDATELPSTNRTLVAVALGRGIQNYTCAAAGSAPVALGAVATLFDATDIAYSNTNLLNVIPAIAVYMPLPSSSGSFAGAGLSLDVLGHHYFDSTGTPTFNLSALNKIGFFAKTASISAPASANKGPAGTGAVAWLQLNSKAGYTSVGLSQVYRVETAGGNPQVSCTVPGVMSIQYAAEYWFYE